jgi:hypothetical protein
MKLFGPKRLRCCFSEESKLFLVASSLANSGGSDNGMVTLIAATCFVLFREMGIEDISIETIAKSCHCEPLISDWEYHLVVHCILLAVKDIKDSGIKVGFLTTDKGHRKGKGRII